MNIKPIDRNQCIITGENVDHLFTFEKFPIYISCTDSDPKDDLFLNMKWGCSKNGTVQLTELIPLDILYKIHHNSGTVGNLWKTHHEKLFEFIKKREFNNVLEIGGASGSLSNKFLYLDKNYTWTNIEPGNHNVNDGKVKIISDYFENHDFEQKYDVVVHSHVFEHVYNPINFLKKINEVLTKDGYQYISIPNMRHWISNGYVNTLMFEHTFYVDEDVLESLLSISGFSIVDKIVDEHSIFVCCKKIKPSYTSTFDTEKIKDLFLDYVKNIFSDVDHIKKSIDENQKIYIFGAHIFSQMILNLGIKESQIISILDNDVKKQGKRLYGTNLLVESPSVLSEQKEPIVILRGGVYTGEITQSLIQINSNVKII